VRGTVVDARTGAPIERFTAQVRALRSVERPGPGLASEALRRKLLDLRAQAADAKTAEERARSDALVRELEEREASLRTAGGADGAARAPIDLHGATEHPGGAFEIGGLDEGIYAVDVSSPQHRQRSLAPVELRRDLPAASLYVELERGVSVHGTVVARQGETPLAGASVDLVRVEVEASVNRDGASRNGESSGIGFAFALPGSHGDVLASAHTDATGGFQLGPVAPGRFLLRASHDQAAPLKSEPFDLDSDRDDFKLVLGATATLEGVVRGVVAGIERDVEVLAVGGFGVMRTTRLRADLAYRFAGLPPGNYLLRAYVAEASDSVAREMSALFSGAEAPAFDVTLAEGAHERLDLTLDLPQVGGVDGTVRINRRSAQGFQVTLRPAPSSPSGVVRRTPRTIVDAQGAFSLRNVPVGDYVIVISDTARREEVHRGVISIAVNSLASVHADLSLGGIRGRIATESGVAGEALDGTLTLVPGANEAPLDVREYGRTNLIHVVRVRGGEFQAENVTAGSALVIVEIRGRLPTQTTIEIPEATIREVTVNAGPAR